MYGIGLSTPTFDINGALYISGSLLDPGTEMANDVRERRVSRTATLDGGVSVYDTGYALGDRDYMVKVKEAPEDIASFFAYLVETYGTIILSTKEGVFLGIPSRYSRDSDGAAILVIQLTEKV